MKPFNLEEAKAGKPVCIRNGSPARILCFDAKHDKHPIVALYVQSDGTEETGTFGLHGHYFSDDEDNWRDLVMAPEKHEGWVNIYRDAAGGARTGSVFTSEVYAKKSAGNTEGYITTVRVEWEE